MESIKEITITKTDDGYKISHQDGTQGGVKPLSDEVGALLFNMLMQA